VVLMDSVGCDVGTVDGDVGVPESVADAGKARGGMPIALFRVRVGVWLMGPSR